MVNHGEQGFILLSNKQEEARLKQSKRAQTHRKSRQKGGEAGREPGSPAPLRHVATQSEDPLSWLFRRAKRRDDDHATGLPNAKPKELAVSSLQAKHS